MSTLEGIRLALLVGHLIGASAIIGPAIAQIRRQTGFEFGPMLVGSIVQILTGAALVAVRRAEDLAVVGAKIGVKGAVALLVLGVVLAAILWQRRLRASNAGDQRVRPLLYCAGLAATINIVVAVIWR